MHQYTLIIFTAAAGAGIFALYAVRSVRRWSGYIDISLAYHRGHLIRIQNEPDSGKRTIDLCRVLVWIIDRDLVQVRKGRRGLGLLWRSIRGDKTPLQITGGMITRIVQYRWVVDPRILRLLNTMPGTIIRLFLICSPVRVPACVYMDLCLVCARIRRNPSSEARMFMEIAAGRV